MADIISAHSIFLRTIDNHAESVAVRTPTGRIVRVFRQEAGYGGGHSGNRGELFTQRSDDAGQTWSISEKITVASSIYDDRNPNIYCTPDGIIGIIYREFDAPTTWNEEGTAKLPEGTNTTVARYLLVSRDDGETWVRESSMPYPGPATSSQDYVPGRGTMVTSYTPWLGFTEDGTAFTWQRTMADSVVTTNGLNECDYAYLGDGFIVGVYRHSLHGNAGAIPSELQYPGYFVCVSSDYGYTWSTPTRVPTLPPQWGSQPCLKSYGNTVYLFAGDRRGSDNQLGNDNQNCKIWIFKTTRDRLLANPTADWDLVSAEGRHNVGNGYWLYGYPNAVAADDYSWLVFYTERTNGVAPDPNEDAWQIIFSFTPEVNYDLAPFIYPETMQLHDLAPYISLNQTAFDLSPYILGDHTSPLFMGAGF